MKLRRALFPRLAGRPRILATFAGRGGRRSAPHHSGARLHEGWVIANHILVAFHCAFISSILSLPAGVDTKGEVLRFVFFSYETVISAVWMFLNFHTAVALHEMAHWAAAARLEVLSEKVLREVQTKLAAPRFERWRYLLGIFLRAPYGKAPGIKREGLNYYPDAPYNLAVAAAGPRGSRNVAFVTLPPAAILIAIGLFTHTEAVIYVGRLLLGIGIVTLLDFLLADPGKYKEFQAQERKAREAADSVSAAASGWEARAPKVLEKLRGERMQTAVHPLLGPVSAPWQFRNCGMGGRHTEKEYPESNISMQEAMFVILGASSAQESQEITVRLQGRLKEIIEKEEGCRVMGIGLEGGLAPYIDRGDYPLPEVRLWAMMKQAIEEVGLVPGVDVALALDPAMSELEIAYREEFNVPDSVGMYLFWRDKTKTVMDRDAVLDLYERAIREYDLPIVSIEDAFSEDDHEGWKKILDRLGDRVLVIGDDLVTTNDRTIERAANEGLINTVLVKANQIGTLGETLVAMLVALGKGMQLVVSHRSKSPNDDMEAHIALAANTLGLKAGGGSNTERLVKYQAVTTALEAVEQAGPRFLEPHGNARIVRLSAREEPTNAGIPTVGADVEVRYEGADMRVRFHGATPLGTSAGTGEAVHLVDDTFERAEHRELVERYADLFREVEPGIVAFRPDVTAARIREAEDEALTRLFERSRRYGGKGCLNAVDNVHQVIAPHFDGWDLRAYGVRAVDRELLRLEVETTRRRGRLDGTDRERQIAVAQRKRALGMNAILSTSLALARATAHAQGRELYQILREEMCITIERLAGEYGVTIEGGRFDDYVAALREVNELLEREGKPLHEELRRITGLYEEAPAGEPGPPRPKRRPPAAAPEGSRSAGASGARSAPWTSSGPPPRHATDPRGAAACRAPEHAPLDPDEERLVTGVSLELARALGPGGDGDARRAALRHYLATRVRIAQPGRRFEIANHRVLVGDGAVVIPYRVDGALVVHGVEGGTTKVLAVTCPPPGTIVTDALVRSLAGTGGEAVDLEPDLFGPVEIEAGPLRIERVRDIAKILEELDRCANENEVEAHLRRLVTWLCSLSSRRFLGAKNLQPEFWRLRAGLVALLDGPFADRMRFQLRFLVRNVSSMVVRPALIDQLWNDTIELAEVFVRGSAITNELRRSTHHSLGRGTLSLAHAYLAYLESGDGGPLAALGQGKLSPADEEARSNPVAIERVQRIVVGLEKLFGGSHILERLAEWQEAYADELLRCDFGGTVHDELSILLEQGLGARNRWVFRHHLRMLAAKACSALAGTGKDVAFQARIDQVEAVDIESADLDVEALEQQVRTIVTDLVRTLRAVHQEELFTALARIVDAFESEVHLEAFEHIHELRNRLEADMREEGFPHRRYLLHQLDCLLEEMGFLALREIASTFDGEGMRLGPCLSLLRMCCRNMAHSGLGSQDLVDLADIICVPGRSSEELEDALVQIQRAYHRVLRPITDSYGATARALGFDDDASRAVLGNLQRFLHDLNSVVHLADLVRTWLNQHPGAVIGISREEALRVSRDGAFDVLHLFDREEIARRVEQDGEKTALREHYGAKGTGLLHLARLGVPTRDGFILPTELARSGLLDEDPERVEREVRKHLERLQAHLERTGGSGRRLGDSGRPLLLAVRGGSAFSMPGILSTVVFVGMNDEVAARLAEDDPWCAYDSYRRFLASYAGAAWGVDLESHDLVERAKRRHGVTYKDELPWEAMREIAEHSKRLLAEAGYGEELEALLADPVRQLLGAIRAVHRSWNSERARAYRSIVGLSETWHTAVVVQEMALGNRRNSEIREGMDESQVSLTGVVLRSAPSAWGQRRLVGEFKFSAAGDDLVGGMTAASSFKPLERLEAFTPMLKRELLHIDDLLCRTRGTDIEIEFTVESGVLSVLQARAALLAAETEVRGLDTEEEPVIRGLGIRGGGFRGLVAFNGEDLTRLREQARAREDIDGVLLVLENPTPDEIPLILAADALLTARGGSSSHAAVAVHGIEERSYTAVLSANGLVVDAQRHRALLCSEEGEVRAEIRSGEILSIDGASGAVHPGLLPLRRAALPLSHERPHPSGGSAPEVHASAQDGAAASS